MEDLERMMEELVKKIRFRDTVSAILISTAFVFFGILLLIVLDVIFVPLATKSYVAIALLASTWIFMSIGVYLLMTMPLPRLPLKIVADSNGVVKLMEKGYRGKVFVSRETYKRLPPKVGLRLNLEIVDVDSKEVEKYREHGEELSYALAIAKRLKAKVVSSEKGKVNGIEVITADELG
ncbi:MAG: hypothetical protein ACK401_01015 [Archaeoglobaceae archaeon]